jgi:hypothetical protein
MWLHFTGRNQSRDVHLKLKLRPTRCIVSWRGLLVDGFFSVKMIDDENSNRSIAIINFKTYHTLHEYKQIDLGSCFKTTGRVHRFSLLVLLY